MKTDSAAMGNLMIKLLATSASLVLACAGIALASSPTDWADLERRIDKLDYQASQSAVPLPPLPIPSKTASQQQRIVVAQSAASLAVRVDRLENQMRIYNGQIEELNFRLRQMQEQLRRFQEDSEFRFQDLERGGKKKRRKQSRAPKPTQPSGNSSFEQLGTPPQSLGSLNGQPNFGAAANGAVASQNSGGSGPIDLSSVLGGGAAQPGATFPGSGSVTQPATQGGSQPVFLTGDPVTDYDQAYGQVLQGNYRGAEAAFRSFVGSYGQHQLASNAHYWIGESQFQQRNYRGAIETFLAAYSSFPNAQKAPDMLLKTGMSLRQIKEREAACATYEELLAKYPNASAGVRQKVRAEIKNAQC
ncbi:MAG: tol-pal system protein YbgF [Cohaesibacter sp.]|jgi:tol-pal system protein YbgF|nr:tol-pal system protein YbgF [Cohaesibacter sp.]